MQDSALRFSMLAISCMAIVVSVLIYIATFFTAPHISAEQDLFFAGIFLNVVFILRREKGMVLHRSFTMVLPRWARIVGYVLVAFYLVSLGMMLWSAGGVSVILGIQSAKPLPDGRYVVDDHGRMIVVMATEYLRWIRLSAAFWIGLYFYTAAYWWFVRSPLAIGGLEAGLAHE